VFGKSTLVLLVKNKIKQLIREKNKMTNNREQLKRDQLKTRFDIEAQLRKITSSNKHNQFTILIRESTKWFQYTGDQTEENLQNNLQWVWKHKQGAQERKVLCEINYMS